MFRPQFPNSSIFSQGPRGPQYRPVTNHSAPPQIYGQPPRQNVPPQQIPGPGPRPQPQPIMPVHRPQMVAQRPQARLPQPLPVQQPQMTGQQQRFPSQPQRFPSQPHYSAAPTGRPNVPAQNQPRPTVTVQNLPQYTAPTPAQQFGQAPAHIPAATAIQSQPAQQQQLKPLYTDFNAPAASSAQTYQQHKNQKKQKSQLYDDCGKKRGAIEFFGDIKARDLGSLGIVGPPSAILVVNNVHCDPVRALSQYRVCLLAISIENPRWPPKYYSIHSMMKCNLKIHKQAIEKDLRVFFKKAGNVKRIDVADDQGAKFAVIEYETINEAIDAFARYKDASFFGMKLSLTMVQADNPIGSGLAAISQGKQAAAVQEDMSWTRCNVCNVDFTDKQAYDVHIQSMMHQAMCGGGISKPVPTKITPQQYYAKTAVNAHTAAIQQMMATNRMAPHPSAPSPFPVPQSQPNFALNQIATKPRMPAAPKPKPPPPRPPPPPEPKKEQPKKKEEEEEEEESSDDDDWTKCDVCDVTFVAMQQYMRHLRGMMHMQNIIDSKVKDGELSNADGPPPEPKPKAKKKKKKKVDDKPTAEAIQGQGWSMSGKLASQIQERQKAREEAKKAQDEKDNPEKKAPETDGVETGAGDGTGIGKEGAVGVSAEVGRGAVVGRGAGASVVTSAAGRGRGGDMGRGGGRGVAPGVGRGGAGRGIDSGVGRTDIEGAALGTGGMISPTGRGDGRGGGACGRGGGAVDRGGGAVARGGGPVGRNTQNIGKVSSPEPVGTGVSNAARRGVGSMLADLAAGGDGNKPKAKGGNMKSPLASGGKGVTSSVASGVKGGIGAMLSGSVSVSGVLPSSVIAAVGVKPGANASGTGATVGVSSVTTTPVVTTAASVAGTMTSTATSPGPGPASVPASIADIPPPKDDPADKPLDFVSSRGILASDLGSSFAKYMNKATIEKKDPPTAKFLDLDYRPSRTPTLCRDMDERVKPMNQDQDYRTFQKVHDSGMRYSNKLTLGANTSLDEPISTANVNSMVSNVAKSYDDYEGYEVEEYDEMGRLIDKGDDFSNNDFSSSDNLFQSFDEAKRNENNTDPNQKRSFMLALAGYQDFDKKPGGKKGGPKGGPKGGAKQAPGDYAAFGSWKDSSKIASIPQRPKPAGFNEMIRQSGMSTPTSQVDKNTTSVISSTTTTSTPSVTSTTTVSKPTPATGFTGPRRRKPDEAKAIDSTIGVAKITEDDEGEDNWKRCTICEVDFKDEQDYLRHTRGMMHIQKIINMKKDDGTLPEESNEGTDWQERIDISEDTRYRTDYDDIYSRSFKPSDIGKEAFKAEFYCELCNVTCTSQPNLTSHMLGTKHLKMLELGEKGGLEWVKVAEGGPNVEITDRDPYLKDFLDATTEALIGLDYIIEYWKTDPPNKECTYVCNLCKAKCDSNTIRPHVVGTKHRSAYLKVHHPDMVHQARFVSDSKAHLTSQLEYYCEQVEASNGRGTMKVVLDREHCNKNVDAVLVKTKQLMDKKKGTMMQEINKGNSTDLKKQQQEDLKKRPPSKRQQREDKKSDIWKRNTWKREHDDDDGPPGRRGDHSGTRDGDESFGRGRGRGDRGRNDRGRGRGRDRGEGKGRGRDGPRDGGRDWNDEHDRHTSYERAAAAARRGHNDAVDPYEEIYAKRDEIYGKRADPYPARERADPYPDRDQSDPYAAERAALRGQSSERSSLRGLSSERAALARSAYDRPDAYPPTSSSAYSAAATAAYSAREDPYAAYRKDPSMDRERLIEELRRRDRYLEQLEVNEIMRRRQELLKRKDTDSVAVDRFAMMNPGRNPDAPVQVSRAPAVEEIDYGHASTSKKAKMYDMDSDSD